MDKMEKITKSAPLDVKANVATVDKSIVKKSKKIKAKYIILVAFILMFATVSFLYYRTYKELKLLKSPEMQAKKAEEEAKMLAQTVGKLILLPTGEVPVIATVNDAKTLAAEQPFYSGAVNGDKLLIYTVAKKAVLYSPSRNVVVNVGPFIPSESNKLPAQP